MSLSLALGSSTSCSAVDGRGGGGAPLTGISLSGSSPPLLRPPLQRGLLLGSHRLRRDARCSFSNSGRASSSEGEGEKTSFCGASGPVTAAAFTSLRPRGVNLLIQKETKALVVCPDYRWSTHKIWLPFLYCKNDCFHFLFVSRFTKLLWREGLAQAS